MQPKDAGDLLYYGELSVKKHLPWGCGNRHCPRCLAAKSLKWLDKQTQSLLLPLRFHSAGGTQFPDADQAAQTLPALVRLRCAASPTVVWNAKTKKKFSFDDMITYGWLFAILKSNANYTKKVLEMADKEAESFQTGRAVKTVS